MVEIKERSDVVINLTTGGAPTMSVQERMQPALQLKPEVASLNMGSMNFGLFPMLARYKEFKHSWERAYLEGTKDLVFKNTFADIEFVLTQGTANGTRFEFECYDTAHLYNLAHFLDRKLATPPLVVARPLFTLVPQAGLAWILAGGALYTIGAVVFHFDSRARSAHFAWHVFVMAGSACHVVAVLGYSTAAVIG